MKDQPSGQTTNVNPIAARQSNVVNEEKWLGQRYPDPGIPPLLGFLQLCADRRFHRCLQDQFQKDTGINSPEDYWIHADAGGTPKMECQRIAPDYCYYDKGARLMGWSAHGDICGGFGPDVPDEVIQQALLVVARRKMVRSKIPRSRDSPSIGLSSVMRRQAIPQMPEKLRPTS